MKNMEFTYVKRLKEIISPYRQKIVLILLIFMLITGISMVLPFVTKLLIDNGFQTKNYSKIVKYSLAFFVLYLIFSLLSIWKESIRLRIYNGFNRDLRKKAIKHLMKIRMDYFLNNNPANIYQFLEEDIASISSIAGEEVFSVLSSLFITVGGSISLVTISWKLSILLIVYLPLKYVVTRKLAIRNMVFTKDYIDCSKQYSHWFGDFVNGIKVVKYYCMCSQKEDQFEKQQETIIEKLYKRTLLATVNEETQTMLIQGLMTAIYILAGVLLVGNEISLGGIIAFETYSLMVITPVSDAFNIVFNISSLMPSISRFYDFIDYPENEDGIIEDCSSFDLTMTDVSFSYGEGKRVIDKLNIDIKEGEKIAIIGSNGIGKTTLVNLIMRIYSPEKGKIELGHTDINLFKSDFYYKSVSVVSQDIFLFNDSIKNNICLMEKIDEEYFDSLIKRVGLDKDIYEKGEDFIVGENGALLSGGQRQKIALARALIRNSKILILDEATSSLDSDTICAMKDLVSKGMEGVTIICITHEPRMLSAFERVVKLEDGHICE